MTATTLLEGLGVSKHFGGLRVLERVTFRVSAGENVALIGPNGAGKTTLFNVISGLLRPSAGAIRLEGDDISRCAPHRIAQRGVGRTFQTPRPFLDLTGEDNVRAAARFGGRRGGGAALLALVELDDVGLASEILLLQFRYVYMLALGLILIAVVLFLPEGLAAGLRRLSERRAA